MSDHTPSSQLETFKGNCHCGAFKYSIQLSELKSVMECNCSICSKKGYKWVYPTTNVFTIEKDDGKLQEYYFGKKNLTHIFCSVCGTGVMGKMQETPNGQMGLNTRSLNDVDPAKLESKHFKGDALEPPYTPTKFQGSEPIFDMEGTKVYTGGCHCGAVTLAFKTKPLSEVSQSEPGVRECDCSICTRNGTINTYPRREQVSIAGEDNLTAYLFGDKHHAHKFCKTCGVAIYVDSFAGPDKAVYEAWPEERQNKRMMMVQHIPVNLRCLDGVEWDQITIKKSEGSRLEPKYVVD
ncbi:Mss4-like protein [Bisporella sp. PMI_857]|nr:Mss4-like protein [Bisporella sp. PMI_857]